MNCSEANAVFIDYVYDQESDIDRESCMAHLAVCEHCSATFNALKTSADALGMVDQHSANLNSISVSSIYSRAIDVQRKHKRRFLFASAIAVCFAVAAVSYLLSLSRVEVGQAHWSISWGHKALKQMPQEEQDIEQSQLHVEMKTQREQLEDVKGLLKLIVAELNSVDRQQERLAVSLASWIRDFEQQDHERWQIVTRGLHRLHLSDLAVQTSMEQVE